MNLREELREIITNSHYVDARIVTDDILQAIREWALELIGEDEGNYAHSTDPYIEDRNAIRQNLRTKLKEELGE